jgi:hypothetical protein
MSVEIILLIFLVCIVIIGIFLLLKKNNYKNPQICNQNQKDEIEKKLTDIKSIIELIDHDIKKYKQFENNDENLTENFCHIVFSLILLFLGIASIGFDYKDLPIFTNLPQLVISIINIYIGILLIECANRSLTKVKCLPLPDRIFALLIMVCLLVGTVTSFGTLYLKSGAVLHTIEDKSDSYCIKKKSECRTEYECCKNTDSREYLSNALDAIYFSAVTITTLGYGDYAPAGSTARCYVVWELVSGLLILLLIFPIVVNRISELD